MRRLVIKEQAPKNTHKAFKKRTKEKVSSCMSNNLRSSSHTRAALEIICEEEEEEEEEEKVFSPIILSPFSLLAAAEAILSSLPISSSPFSPDEFVRGSPLHPPSTSHHLSSSPAGSGGGRR